MSVIPLSGIADPFSSLSHLFGAVVFAVLSVPLLARARGSTERVVSVAIFCIGAVSLLSISGVYHLLDPTGPARMVMQRLDHAAIFVLIAASFTPIHVILFRGWGKWGILALVWVYAIVAIGLKAVFFYDMPTNLSLSLYLVMGWIGLFPGLVLWHRYGFAFVRPLVAGGLAYTMGGILEALHWPVIVPGVVQWHECFHVAVLVGLTCHWAFIYHIADGRLTPAPTERAGLSPSPAAVGEDATAPY